MRRTNDSSGGAQPRHYAGQGFFAHCAKQREEFSGTGADGSSSSPTTSHHLRRQLDHCQTTTIPSYAARARQAQYPFLPDVISLNQDIFATTTNPGVSAYSEFGHYSLPWLQKPVNTGISVYRLTREERLVSCRFSPDGQVLAVLGQDKIFTLNHSSHSFRYGSRDEKKGVSGSGEAEEEDQCGKSTGLHYQRRLEDLREDLGATATATVASSPRGAKQVYDVPAQPERDEPEVREEDGDDDEDPLLRQLFGAGFQRRAPQATRTSKKSKSKRFGAEHSVLDSVRNIQSVGWSLLDCSWSHDSEIIAVGGWSSNVHLYRRQDPSSGAVALDRTVTVNIGDDDDDAEGYSGRGRGPGVFSLSFLGHNNSLIVCGTNENAAVVADVERQEVMGTYPHMDDVNAVSAFPDGHTFVTGSDDATIKVHDVRSPASVGGVGFLLGHSGGVASVDCHSDGYHLVSAGKDQCAKLFDIRRMVSTKSEERMQMLHQTAMYSASRSDYRYGNAAPPPTSSRRDNSILTFHSSHFTVVTLCRARISPTGRHVACASADSVVTIYDTLTGEATRMEGHDSVVRDVSWHPELPVLASASWDGSVRLYGNDEYILQHPGGGPAGQSAAAATDTADLLMGLSPDDFYDALDTDEEEDEFY